MIINSTILSSQNNFITYGNKTYSFEVFFKEVKLIIEKFKRFEQCDDFILINEQNPINFYILLFALWECKKKVVFPTRDFFEGANFSFVKYVITHDVIIQNYDFKSLKMDIDNYDTVLFSSGSTGKPKGIVHNQNTFFKNAQSVLTELDISNIVSVTPLKPYLVSALSHLLVHLLSESHLLFIDVEKISEIENISKNYDELSYVGSPMHIISMLPFVKNVNAKIFFSSGDIFYPSVIKEIFDTFPKTYFFNVYGMAEVGGRLFMNKLTASSKQEDIKSIGSNINLTNIKIESDEVYIKSDLLFKGYIKENLFYTRKEEYFASGDHIIKVGENLEFFGRKNDEIKVAGNKVSMKYLEQMISSILPDTFTPIVVNKLHELLGNILVLIIYSKNEISLSRHEIISLLRESMKSHELPHIYYYINEIPYTQTMKIDRKKLIKKLDTLEILK